MASSNSAAETIGAILGIGVVVLLYGFFHGWFTRVDVPEISIDGGTDNGDVVEVEMPSSNNSSIYIRTTGTTDIEKANMEFYFNDNELGEDDKCGQGCWKIPAKKVSIGSQYTLKAKNTAGEDTVEMKVVPKAAPPTSSKPYDNRSTTTHLLCKKYAEQYFYPLKVKLHDIVGVRHDAETSDGSWKYNLYATTTNAAGAEQKFIVDCIVGNFSNNNESGEIMSFDTMLAP